MVSKQPPPRLERIKVIEVRGEGKISIHSAWRTWSWEDDERRAERLEAMKRRMTRAVQS